MNKIKCLIISMVFVLAITSWMPATPGYAADTSAAPAAGTPISLTVTNPLPKATTVTLSGSKSYTINVPQGATITKTIDPGKYKFLYQGCLGKPKKGNLKVKGSNAALKIAPCKMATWTFFNPNDTEPYTLRLKGWVNYNVTIGPGQLLRFTWVADTYQASRTFCGDTYDFKVKVSGKKSWVINECD